MAGLPVTVWRFMDGKAGHEKQTLGLLNALARRTAIEVRELRGAALQAGWWDWLRKRFPAGAALPAPTLLLGAGHRTHLPMLAAQRAFGGRTVALMRPSLPARCFDYLIVPEHDQRRDPRGQQAHVLVTKGVLNPVQAQPRPDGRGLILVGGPNARFVWHDDAVLAQVHGIVDNAGGLHWQIGDSRRTPAALSQRLQQAFGERFCAWQHCDGEWLTRQMAQAGTIWVTMDSVSMLYEALSSSAGVGLIELPVQRRNRLQQGVDRLIAERLVTPYSRWLPGSPLPPPTPVLAEADRAANWLLEQLNE